MIDGREIADCTWVYGGMDRLIFNTSLPEYDKRKSVSVLMTLFL